VLVSTDVGLTPEQSTTVPLLVRLPATMANFFNEVGYMPTAFVEKRSHARMRVRCESMITCVSAPAFVKRELTASRVLVKDLSRCGVGVLSHQQMWPTETFFIELNNRRLSARVVRCRKLGESCYEIGAVVSAIENLADSDDSPAQDMNG